LDLKRIEIGLRSCDKSYFVSAIPQGLLNSFRNLCDVGWLEVKGWSTTLCKRFRVKTACDECSLSPNCAFLHVV